MLYFKDISLYKELIDEKKNFFNAKPLSFYFIGI
jgi:hypothetical protein